MFLGGSVPPGPENRYPISDQNIWFSIPYFRPQNADPIADPASSTVVYFRQISIATLGLSGRHDVHIALTQWVIQRRRQDKYTDITQLFCLRFVATNAWNDTLLGGRHLFGLCVGVCSLESVDLDFVNARRENLQMSL